MPVQARLRVPTGIELLPATEFGVAVFITEGGQGWIQSEARMNSLLLCFSVLFPLFFFVFRWTKKLEWTIAKGHR